MLFHFISIFLFHLENKYECKIDLEVQEIFDACLKYEHSIKTKSIFTGLSPGIDTAAKTEALVLLLNAFQFHFWFKHEILHLVFYLLRPRNWWHALWTSS